MSPGAFPQLLARRQVSDEPSSMLTSLPRFGDIGEGKVRYEHKDREIMADDFAQTRKRSFSFDRE